MAICTLKEMSGACPLVHDQPPPFVLEQHVPEPMPALVRCASRGRGCSSCGRLVRAVAIAIYFRDRRGWEPCVIDWTAAMIQISARGRSMYRMQAREEVGRCRWLPTYLN